MLPLTLAFHFTTFAFGSFALFTFGTCSSNALHLSLHLLCWRLLLEKCDGLPFERGLALQRLDDEVELEGEVLKAD